MPLLLAFFTWPMLFWGVALGSIPVIIHLLHKRKYRETSWAAMRFLLAAARKHSRRLRLEQLILLAVRTLILLFVVAGLRGAWSESSETFVRSEGPTHRIIVLDASFSMQYRPDARPPRFDQAREEALKIVRAAGQGDLINVVQIAGSSPPAIVRKPVHPSEVLEQQVGGMRPSEEPGRLAAALREVVSLLDADAARRLERKQVYILTDAQRASWLPDSNEARSQLRKTVEAVTERGELMIVDLADAASPNTAVTGFAASEPFVIGGRPVRLEIDVRNFSESRFAGRTLELLLDGRPVDVRRIDLPPNSEVSLEIDYPDASRGHPELPEGEHVFEVRLQDDALALDNRRRLSLPVISELKVLLVDGRPSGVPGESATFYVERALNPSGTETGGTIRPRVIAEGELPGFDLSRFDCVFLCNVRRLTPGEARLLESYVAAGGGLVVCLGDRTDPDSYNDVLYRDGEGLLPARLVDRVAASPRSGRFHEFDTSQLTHPILGAFAGNPGAGLETVLTFQYVRAVPAGEATRTVLRFQKQDADAKGQGDPVIVEAAAGRGRVLLVTTAVDSPRTTAGGAWNTWPSINPSFLPMMHEIVRFAVGGRWGDRNLAVGRSITRALPQRTTAAAESVSLRTPDGETATVTAVSGDGVTEFSFSETFRSGVYELLLRPPLGRPELYAVNVDPAESDLARASQNQLEAELLKGIPHSYRSDWRPAPFTASLGGTVGSAMTRWFLLAALALLFVEVLMAWRFYYGFVLLYAVVSFEFVRQAALWSIPAAAVLAAALAAGLTAIVLRRRRAQTGGSTSGSTW